MLKMDFRLLKSRLFKIKGSNVRDVRFNFLLILLDSILESDHRVFLKRFSIIP